MTDRERRQRNAEWARQKARRTMAMLRERKGTTCAECGLEYHPCQLQFAHLPEHRASKPADMRHVNGKRRYSSFSQLAFSRTDVFLKEVEKCRVLCANCHALEGYREKHWLVDQEGAVEDTQMSMFQEVKVERPRARTNHGEGLGIRRDPEVSAEGQPERGERPKASA